MLVVRPTSDGNSTRKAAELSAVSNSPVLELYGMSKTFQGVKVPPISRRRPVSFSDNWLDCLIDIRQAEEKSGRDAASMRRCITLLR